VQKSEEQLKTLINEDEDDHIAALEKDKKLKPEDDAYLAETGRILLDWLSLAPMASRK
jgi:carboxyl-terminal processing protease